MNLKNFGKLCLISACLIFGSHAAQGQTSGPSEDKTFTCGLSDEEAGAGALGGLAKSAALPYIAKTWSGKFKVLVLRVEFSDAAYDIDTATIKRSNASVSSLFRNMSRNTMDWDWKIYPLVLKAPGTRATYGTNFSLLQSWIYSQIIASGLKKGIDYDFYVASFPQIDVVWAGLSNLREGNWINGHYSAGVLGHEMGHSLGLPHAHSVEAGTDMFGTPGTTEQTNEYGNPYDIMGRGGSSGHFNVFYKWRVGWEDPEELHEVKTSGVYRIYAQDNAVHRNRTIGLRVPSGNTNYAYWFEYRTNSTSARNGATVLFQGFRTNAAANSWFLDTTPGSRPSADEADGVLSVGKQFQDKYSQTTFKALAINTGTWNEEGWVDVQVNITGAQPVTLLPNIQSIRIIREGTGAAFNLMGRAISGLRPAQTMAVKRPDGSTRLMIAPLR